MKTALDLWGLPPKILELPSDHKENTRQILTEEHSIKHLIKTIRVIKNKANLKQSYSPEEHKETQ